MELMVELAGGLVWVEDRGTEGVPVLLLHPGWGDSSIWDRVTEQIPLPARVIRTDVRGYGRSPASSGPFTLVGDVVDILDRLAVATAIVVGHSGGGATAISVALSRPDRVCSLLLVAPGVDGYPWPQGDPYLARFRALYQAHDREGLIALGLRTWAVGDPGALAQAQIRSAVDAMLRQGDQENAGPPSYDRLDQVYQPTQVVIGDRDYPMVIDCATAIVARIPGCHLTSLPGVDHMVPLRAPERLAHMINTERRRHL
jgi:pimeloyl-ACP methyl ester carboxylesterase